MHNIRNYTTPIIATTATTTKNDMNNKHSVPKLNGFSDSHSIGSKQLNGMSLISHLTSSFLAASAASNGHNHHHSGQHHSTCSSTSSSSTNSNTVCNAKSTYRSGQRNSLTRNSSVNDDQLTSSRNSTSSSSFLSLASCPSSANKHSLASTTHRNSIVNYAENDSVFEESSLLSSSNQRMDDLKQNFEEEDDDNDAVAVLVSEDVIDDVDIDEDIIIKKSNININNHQDDYLDDFNASIDNLSKLKLKQENIDFLNLIKKCQNWIETTTAKKFQYPNDFRKSLENGVLLCELLNVLKKNCVRRINRYPTPIAGIDNLNVFLKACQQNFQLAQSNLFDTIDLEDLNKRRGNNNNINGSQNNCNSNIIKKDLNDSTDETTSHCNNQSKEIDSTNSTNENILDEEQQRRLKKVVNTIYWLSRKAIELGIPLAYQFETNNHSHSNTSNTIKNNTLKQNAKVSSSNTSSFYYSSNLSLNQYSSSTSSSLSSSSSFIASISSSASSSASTSSSSHHNNNQHQHHHHNTNNLLSVIVSTPVVSANHQQSTNTKFSTNNINAPNPQLLLKKKYNSNNKKIIKSADELETSTNGPDNMSYIYKQQTQLVTNKNTNNNISNTKNQRSASIQIDAIDSFLLGKNLAPSKNSSKHPNSNNDSSNFTSSPSSSSPGSIAGGANHHMQASTLPNSSGHLSSNNYLTDSQDDLQLIDSTMSPISSSTNSAISPHLLSTSSSANLSNSNSNLAGINSALGGSAGSQQQQTTNNKTMVIPTRFVDRRVSTGVNQTYKFNYSEAGKKMAKQAQEQLKTVEKCKEKNEDAAPTLDPVRSKRAENSNGSGSGSGGGSINDDWQNTVDDWKKRRREKVKMPPPRNGQNGEILDDEDQQQQYTKSERKRINRFENSHYYIQPLSENDDNLSNDLNNEINAVANMEGQQPVNNGQEFVLNEKKNSKAQNDNKTSAATIEISGVRNHSVDKENQVSPKSNLLLKNQQKSNQLNDSIQPSDDISMNENDTSVCNIYYSYVFVEKTVDLTRTDDYNLRGFGFLLKNGSGNNHLIHSTLSERTNFILSQNYAEIVGLDPHSLADKAGLKKGDLVVKINECPTSNLSSEQLRKIMTDRLKLNSIQMTVLSLEKPDLNKIEEEKEELVENKIINEKIEEKFISKSNLLLNNVNGSKPPHQDYNLLAPKPYRKSLPSSVSTSTLTSSSNQLLLLSNLTEMNVTTTNSTLNINNNSTATATASSLIDKQKSQLTLILNWTTQEQVSSHFTPSLISPDLSAFGSYDSSSSMCSLVAAGLKTSGKPVSLSPSSSIELTDDGNNSSIYDSLNEIICKNNKNLLHSIPYNPTTSGDLELQKEETKIKTNVNYDDTDHDNDDVDSDELLLPPPIPATEPPPLPSSGSVNLLNNTNNVSKEIVAPTDLIKKELKDKMKCVENWKIEQEILMKRKYQEEQKKIEISLKVDLEKVKEEENQRREQERLKLEKERLRLQELELKEREHELKSNSLLKTAETETDSLNQQTQPTKSSSTVRKEDLTALIEKIYTEQANEADFLIEYTQPPTAKSSAVQEPKPANKPLPSPSQSSSSSSSFSLKPSTIVMTKTSPIVAAALSCEEEDLYLMELNNKMASKHEREIFTDLIDTTNKHQIIKQVHDSMDNLKNQLLHKGMNKYADDVDNMNKNLDATRKKQEELERIKREQEQIKIEKERIEQEKEKLRQEAEQLRIERELILMAATSKAAVMSAVTPSSSSSSSSSTTMNEQIEPDYGIANNQTDYNNSYKTPNYLSDHQVNSLGASLSSSSLSPPRKYYPDNGPMSHKSGLMMSQPQSWLIEEVERKRMLNSNQIINPMTQAYTDQQQRLRRSYPNLLIDSNSFDPRSTNINYMNSQSSFINTPLSSTTGFTKIYSKKKPSSSSSQQQSVSRPIKMQQHRNSSQQSVINSANCLYTNAKPPQPSHRLISNSSNDLKSVVKIQQNKHQLMGQQPQHQFSKNTSLSNNTQPSTTIISLNQQCSSCSHALGQGSAMFIEKLGLAFHLKCFRCSVCSIPLGNGKEGTDVRVSVTNRLHCNNCFSNDLGVRLSAV